MPLIVELPSVLAARTGQRQVQVEARTVRAAIHAIDAQFPGFAADVLPDGSRIRSSLCIVLDGHTIWKQADLDREIADGSTVEIDIVSMVMGG